MSCFTKSFTKALSTFLQAGQLGRNLVLQTRELFALIPDVECFRLLLWQTNFKELIFPFVNIVVHDFIKIGLFKVPRNIWGSTFA